ncbi:MAG TPA: acyl carrier protein [Trebonia sp.]|nr:acyl carrier protein [Trebonia sp.]
MGRFDVSEIQKFVCGRVSAITGSVDVLITDDFFSAGGDSFDAIVLSAEIVQRYGVTIHVADVLDAESFADLSNRIADALVAAGNG